MIIHFQLNFPKSAQLFCDGSADIECWCCFSVSLSCQGSINMLECANVVSSIFWSFKSVSILSLFPAVFFSQVKLETLLRLFSVILYSGIELLRFSWFLK